MRNFLNLYFTKIAVASRFFKNISNEFHTLLLQVTLLLSQKSIQKLHIIFNLHCISYNKLLKIFLLSNPFNWLNFQKISSNKMRLSVLIDDKFCLYLLNNTFVIFLYEFDKRLNDVEELFVQECIKELVSFEIFGLCKSFLMFGSHIRIGINRQLC